MLDVIAIKKDFPIFGHSPSLTYLDSTATSLKPKPVIEALRRYYEEYSANIFRGIYSISEKATADYEATREAVATFINARPDEIIFTRNTTESLNLLAYSYVGERISKGDELVASIMEHHSNFVPWQQLALQKGASLKILQVTADGSIGNIESLVTKKTKILALTYISNVLGTVTDIKNIINTAKRINPGITIIVDAAQAAPHRSINVQELGADFIAFSSHKMLGPTGVGVLWGKAELLRQMKPFLYGGEMIQEVYKEKTVFRDIPHKFEAGTPSIAEVIGLKEAVLYLHTIGLDEVEKHETKLAQQASDRLRSEFPGIRILGPKERQSGIVSFYFDHIHAHDIAHVLAEENICVRAGHHCAMPLHLELNIDATVRASFYMYNDSGDIDKLVRGIGHALQVLQ